MRHNHFVTALQNALKEHTQPGDPAPESSPSEDSLMVISHGGIECRGSQTPMGGGSSWRQEEEFSWSTFRRSQINCMDMETIANKPHGISGIFYELTSSLQFRTHQKKQEEGNLWAPETQQLKLELEVCGASQLSQKD